MARDDQNLSFGELRPSYPSGQSLSLVDKEDVGSRYLGARRFRGKFDERSPFETPMQRSQQGRFATPLITHHKQRRTIPRPKMCEVRLEIDVTKGDTLGHRDATEGVPSQVQVRERQRGRRLS